MIPAKVVLDLERVRRRPALPVVTEAQTVDPVACGRYVWRVLADVQVVAGPVPFGLSVTAEHEDARIAVGAALRVAADALLKAPLS